MQTTTLKIAEGTRLPRDDFYCQKYQVWYRVEDCVYRGRHRTFAGCVDCIQGYVNMKSVERGVRPPICLGSPSSASQGSAPARVLPMRRASRD